MTQTQQKQHSLKARRAYALKDPYISLLSTPKITSLQWCKFRTESSKRMQALLTQKLLLHGTAAAQEF